MATGENWPSKITPNIFLKTNQTVNKHEQYINTTYVINAASNDIGKNKNVFKVKFI